MPSTYYYEGFDVFWLDKEPKDDVEQSLPAFVIITLPSPAR